MTSQIHWQAEPCRKFVLSFIVASLFILSIMPAHAAVQTAGIKGKVTDSKNDPLYGATVSIVNVQGHLIGQGAQADINGDYILSPLAPGTYTIQARYVGCDTKTIKGIIVNAGAMTVSNIQLTESFKELDQVVVTGSKYEKKYAAETVSMSVIRSNGFMSAPIGGYEHDAPALEQSDYGKATYNWQTAKVKSKRDEESAFIIEKRTGFENYEDMMPLPYPVDDATRDTMTAATYKEIKDNLFISPAAMPLSTFSIDVDVASYGMTRKKITDGMLPPTDAVRIEEMVNYFPYNYADPTDDKPFAVHTEFAECPWDATHRLLRIGVQGKRIKEENLPPINLVFLVDVSGSMMSPERLPLIQKSLDMLVDRMRPQDRISLVAYAGNAGLVLPSTSGAEKEKIKQAINNLEAGGSTAGGAGIELAYKVAVDNFIKGGNNRVMLCTDGDFNVGISGEGPLTSFIEQKRKTGVFLSVLGVGTDNYKDREMEALADKGNGNYAYIDNEKEAKKNLVTQMAGTLNVIAKDVKIQAVFNPACVKSYRLIGYEDRKLENKDFSNDKVDAGEIGAGTAVTAIYEIVLGPDRKQSTVQLEDAKGKDEMTLAASDLMGLRIRYKAPDGHKSQLIESHVSATSTDLASTSEDFRFAASVAGFGMLLRNSPFKGDFTYDKAKALAKGSLGSDKENYRHDFLNMIDQAHSIAGKTASK